MFLKILQLSNEDYKKGLFNVEGLEENYIGYCKNDTWNGWVIPCFEKDTVIKMLDEEYIQCCYTYIYNSESDTFTLKPNEGFGDYIEEYKGFDIEYNNEIKHVYGVGAAAWCWDKL